MAKPSPTHAGSAELKALGLTIRKLRIEAGLSQEALALQAGIDRSYLGGIERGEHNVAVMNLVRISHCLGCPVGMIFMEAAV